MKIGRMFAVEYAPGNALMRQADALPDEFDGILSFRVSIKMIYGWYMISLGLNQELTNRAVLEINLVLIFRVSYGHEVCRRIKNGFFLVPIGYALRIH